MKSSKENKSEVASVAVINGTKILMGKRRDNERYTIPGGHLNEGEKPVEGAKRELLEEAGIKHEGPFYIGSDDITTFTGKQKTIHAFVVNHDGPATSKNDPDKEVSKWDWIDTKEGLPKHVIENLHSPKNVVLKKLGLLKALYFVGIDLIKARPHKYIRKYQRNGKWIYIYHEGDQHGRAISEEAVGHIRQLSELGDEHARGLHESIEEHAKEKLEALRELADLGDKDAHEHLKRLGINRHAEKAEDKILAATNRDPIDLDQANPAAVHAKIKEAVNAHVFGHLTAHQTSPFSVNLRNRGITIESIMRPVMEEKSLRGMLTKLHESLKEMDAAHVGLSSANNTVQSAGSYGNVAYNKAVKKLEESGVLPAGYSELHKRSGVAGSATANKIVPVREMQERQERARQERVQREARERAEREERDRRELAEVHGSMAHHLSSISDERLSTTKIKDIHRAFKEIFGKNLRKEDWPYDFSAQGLNVKIAHVNVGANYVSMEFKVLDSAGRNILGDGLGWSRQWSKRDGKPHIYNSTLGVKPEHRKYRLGHLINAAQRKLMVKHTTNGMIGVTAASTVGGYNWANNGFRFADSHTASSFRSSFKTYLQDHGIRLTPQELNALEHPCHFAAFDDGKTYSIRTLGESQPLTELQKRSGFLDGKSKHPLTAAERSSGKSNRLLCSLGKAFLLGKSWSGIWSVADHKTSIPDKYATHYNNSQKDEKKTLATLGKPFQDVLKKVKKQDASNQTSGSASPPKRRATRSF